MGQAGEVMADGEVGLYADPFASARGLRRWL